jgi:hypothetical protein
MTKKLAVAAIALLLALAAWFAAGPWLTIHSMREAIEADDAAALAAQVDFPAVRASLKRQFADRIVRAAGPDAQSSVLGALAIRVATGAGSVAVDALANPLGLTALVQGRSAWRAAVGDVAPPAPAEPAPRPFEGADYRYESLSRFTATVRDDAGRPVVFVLGRRGLRWKLVDVRLPP